MTNQLPPQTVKRIEEEAKEKYCSPYGKANPETYAYISGATSEAQRNRELVEALEEIVNPIKYMKQRLKEGEQINGIYAVELSKDHNHLKSIAQQALKNYQQ